MRHITRCLNTQLIEICQQAIKLEELTEIVQRFLPEVLRPHCQVGSFQKGTLNLIVNSSVWGSQLRYILPELRDKLRKEASIYQLVSIKITLDLNLA